MFDKGGEGFFADGKRALPSPWPFLFPHPYGGTGEGSGEPSGQRQKNSPVRKGWGRLEQGEYDQKAAFPFFIPRGMMRAAGIAMPGVSVYRLAAGAGAAGPPGGMGCCHAGREASCGRAPGKDGKTVPYGLWSLFGKDGVYSLFSCVAGSNRRPSAAASSGLRLKRIPASSRRAARDFSGYRARCSASQAAARRTSSEAGMMVAMAFSFLWDTLAESVSGNNGSSDPKDGIYG